MYKRQPLYDAVSDINHQILAMGSTLVNLDAMEVYFNGNTYDGVVSSIPQSFFAQPQDSTDFQVTLMQHKNTGRNYLMIVNNSFTDRATIALKLDGAVSSLELAGKSDAGTSTWSWENGLLSIQADIGGAYLLSLIHL